MSGKISDNLGRSSGLIKGASGGADNTPAFFAFANTAFSITGGSNTKLVFNEEVFDTDSKYDKDTNYRFTPGTAGKYFVHYGLRREGWTASDMWIMVYKNGSEITRCQNFDHAPNNSSAHASCVLTLDDDDYIEVFGWQNYTTQNGSGDGTVIETYFGAFKIAGT